MRGFGKQKNTNNKKLINKKDKFSQEKILKQAINYHILGNTKAASKCYVELINRGTLDHRVFSNYGTILSDNGQLSIGESYLRKAIKLKPNDASAHSNLGNNLRNKGKSQEAKELYEKAIKLKPDFAEAHYNLGITLKDIKELKEAEICILRAINLKPDIFEAHYNLGIIRKNLGKLKEAEESTRKAIKLNPSSTDAYNNLGILLKDLKKVKESEESFRKAIKIKPNNVDALSNLGVLFKDSGHYNDAELFTRKAIEFNPNCAEAISNLGIILKDIGKLKEAELYTRQAIKIKPNIAAYYSNLGNIFRDQGNLSLAQEYQQKAIKLKPNYAEAYSNLGNILRDLGNYKDAESYQRKAIEIKTELVVAHYNLGNILRELKDYQAALDSYLNVIKLNPNYYNIYVSITKLFKDSDPSKFDKIKLDYILNLILERNDVSHKDCFRAFIFLYKNSLKIKLDKTNLTFNKIELLINNKIIINAIKKIIIEDFELEKLLNEVRKYMCIRIDKSINHLNSSELQFLIALGQQCFLNEYVYSTTIEEDKSINKILNKCISGEINEANIIILSCYFPLYKLLNKIKNLKYFYSSNQEMKELIKLQISEPIKEIELSKSIKSLGLINDFVSIKVRAQYEENPYPRWRYGNLSLKHKISFSQAINNEIKPNSICKDSSDKRLKILIAGCGTGKQILQTQSYKNAEVTAIDFSLSSLSYAQRKINELGIDNVKLIHMDILEVSLLKEKYDIVESGGVIHHMNDPSKGIKVLLEVLKDDGFLKLGLYSNLARKDIVKAREYIKNKNLQPNEDDIRNFRQTIISDKLINLQSITKIGDFYSLSQCRDLCFHAKEHRFTIGQLQGILTSNKLKFLGFLLRQPIKSLYEKNFPEDKKQTNLDNWDKFEELYPNTFRGMYQFWVSR